MWTADKACCVQWSLFFKSRTRALRIVSDRDILSLLYMEPKKVFFGSYTGVDNTKYVKWKRYGDLMVSSLMLF